MWVTLGAIAAVVLFWWNAANHGAIGIPRDDDWSYLKTAFTFYRTGVIDLNGWAYTTLLGQLVLAWPVIAFFGASIAALQGMVAVLSVLGIILGYSLLRRVTTRAIATLAMVTAVAGPIYGTVSTNFMTDVPVLTLQMATLLLGVIALQKSHPWPWLAASSMAGIAAFSIRQSGIIALVVVWVVLAGRRWVERRRVWSALGWAAAIAAAIVPIYIYRQSLPNGVYSALDFPPFPRPDLPDRAVTIARSFTTLALLCAPAVLVISPTGVLRASWRRSTVGAVTALAVLVACIGLAGNWLLGNHVHPFGDTWMAAGEGARLLPLNAYRLVLLLADALLVIFGLTGWLIALRAVDASRLNGWRVMLTRSLQSHPTELIVFGFGPAALGANLAATALLGAPFIDRYLIATVPFTVVGLAEGARLIGVSARLRPTVAVPAVAAFVAFGFLVVDFAATVDGAKWNFAQRAVSSGIRADQLDGGVEWFGFHQTSESGPLTDMPGRTWWTTRFPDQAVCDTIQISGTDRLGSPAPEMIEQQTYPSLFGHRIVLSLVRGPDRCS